MNSKIWGIEKTRRTLNIPTAKLCAAAGVDHRHYKRLQKAESIARPATLAKLSLALNRFRIGFADEARDLAPHAAYRASLVVAAFACDAEPRQVLASDPAKRATLNPDWLAASRVRRIGYFIASQFLGFRTSDLARAAGVTKQAISSALRELYDERDTDPELDRVLVKLEEIFE